MLGVPRFCQLVFASTLSYPYLASSVSFEVGLSRYCKLGLHITLQKVDYSALQVRFDSKVWLPRNCKLGLFQKLGYPDDPSWVCFIRWVTQILHGSCASEIGLFRCSKLGFIQKLFLQIWQARIASRFRPPICCKLGLLRKLCCPDGAREVGYKKLSCQEFSS
jgi:hypothetical protein